MANPFSNMHPDEYELVCLEALSAGFTSPAAYLEWLDMMEETERA